MHRSTTIRFASRALLYGTLLIPISVSLLAAPAAAVSAHKSQCRRLTRQIGNFEDVAERAADRGNRLWLNSTLQHIERLSERRVRLCPEYAEPDYLAIYAAWAADIFKKAARAFVTFMTFGV